MRVSAYLICVCDDMSSACAGLTSITFPDGLTSIGDAAFDCENNNINRFHQIKFMDSFHMKLSKYLDLCHLSFVC